MKEIALKAAALDKVNKERSRMIVFTQGADKTIVAKGKLIPSDRTFLSLEVCSKS